MIAETMNEVNKCFSVDLNLRIENEGLTKIGLYEKNLSPDLTT